jgi:glycosyltransferase involved in cell wall biosynthesis
MARPRVHLINRFELVAGSELRALGLARILAPHADVRLWATDVPHSRLCGVVPIELIEPRKGRFPRSGIFVFVGVYYSVGRWIRATRPSRRIVILNTPQPDMFALFERQTAKTFTLRPVPCEIVYASDLLRPVLGRPGIVQESPVDLQTFRPRPQPRPTLAGTFRVGRFSRDVPEKFHADDPALFHALAAAGIDLALMGGASLGLARSARIVVTAPGAQPAPDFLQTLDCFLYRTDSRWLDTFPRVVFEAMACGLPVVVDRLGGHAAYIEQGVNGFLFDGNAEAMAHIVRLRDDPALRAAMGHNARQTVERLYSDAYERRLVDFYTTGHPAPSAPRVATS